jgi:D-3-phosphoglycerate dehydrogenase
VRGGPFTVCLTEPIHPDGTALLMRAATIRYAGGHDEAGLAAALADADGLILRVKGRVTDSLLARAPHLKVIARHGVGVDNVDVAAATRRRIPVCVTLGANTDAVAEHTFLLMLAVGKRLVAVNAGVRRGSWEALRGELYGGLNGRTLGIVGMGRVGIRVAELAAAFGMRRLGYDPALPREEIRQRGAEPVDLSALLRAADIVTLHAPLTPETRHLINRDTLSLMKPGAILVNTSRGGVIDDAALAEALRSGRLAGAGIDVTEPEPPSPDHPLLPLEQVLITPHIAAHTEDSMRRMAVAAAEQVLMALEGKRPTMAINPEIWDA